MTPEERGLYSDCVDCVWLSLPAILAQFEDAVDRVRGVIGDEKVSGIPNNYVNDIVWNNYFDVDRSIEDLLGSSQVDCMQRPST